MSKIKLLLDVVNDMRSLADSVGAVANAMTGSEQQTKPAKTSKAKPKKEEKPAEEPIVHTKLSEIDPKDYPALLADAEAL